MTTGSAGGLGDDWSRAEGDPGWEGEGARPSPGGAIPINSADLERLGSLVRARLGIQITEQKRALVSARLQRRLRELGIGSFAAYCDKLEADPTGEELSELANRISTNHTFFFREAPHFKLLSGSVLPEITGRLGSARSLDLRVWCAACATGEEAYTLAMLVQEHLGSDLPSWQAGLLATDISAKALRVAVAGVYGADRIGDVPAQLRNRYFRPLPDEQFAVVDALKADVTFRRFNLIAERFRFRRPFHVIFCRNVMIYFDIPTREKLVARMVDVLEPGGYLFIGHSESLGRNPPSLVSVQPAVYRKETRR